jgi:UDP-N-acetylmuramoyl-tripeptide--D-alanyl-D-alanine ligase
MNSFIVRLILVYIRYFARKGISKHKPSVIGITGSVGKSSTRNIIYAALRDHVNVKVLDKGNSEIGIPLALLGLTSKSLGFQTVMTSIVDWARILRSAPFSADYLKGTQYVIAEMGVDEPDPPKNMGYLLTILKPQIAVFLNVFPAHTLQFDPVIDHRITDPQQRLAALQRAIAYEKGKIITESDCTTGIYNADNQFVVDAVESFYPTHPQTKQLTFGTSTESSISYGEYVITTEGTKFEFIIQGAQGTVSLAGYVLPIEYRELIAASLLVAHTAGISYNDAARSIEKNFSLPAGRSSLFKGIHKSLIIDSSYNASRISNLAFISLAHKLAVQEKRKLVFLMGDMRELGQEAATEHEQVAKELMKYVDTLYLVGPQVKKYVIPYIEKHAEISQVTAIKWFENSIQAGAYMKEHIEPHSLILVKGSQNTIYLEEAIKQILESTDDQKKLCRQEPHWLAAKGIA